MPLSRDEIYQKVQAVLVDALGVDEEEVTPNAVIRDDLGAESIDFLDIMFRLEKAYGIKIPRGEMIPENLADNPEVVQNGVVSPPVSRNSKNACRIRISPRLQKIP